MNPALVILFVLFTTSSMLCVAMTLAWLHFGRQRHALSWALAYGGGAVQWAINAVMLMLAPGHPLPIIVGTLLVLTTSSLIAIGCRQRAGLRPHFRRFALAAAIAGIAITLTVTVFPWFGLRVVIANLYVAAMIPIALAATWPRNRKARAPEIAFMVMLVIFGVYQLVLAAVGFAIGPDADPQGIDRYRSILVLGLPPVHIGTGIAALFLLAGDLADSVRSLVTRDPLTGSLNRRGIEQAAVGAIANARRNGRPLTLVIGDIDRFKAINDRFGHAVGDRALIAFADHVHASAREEDLFARMGGDDFCLLFIDAMPDEAAETIERTRRELEGLVVDAPADFAMTASFGITAFEPRDVGFGDMLKRADLALLESKLAGRNRVTVAGGAAHRVSGKAAR